MAIDPRQKSLWLYEMRLNGYILFRNFLPVPFVESLYEQCLPLYNGERTRLAAGDTSSLRGRNRMSFDLARYAGLLKGPLDDERFRHNPVIEELVGSLMGRWRYGVTKAECPFKDSDTMSWHPDSPSDPSADPDAPVRTTRVTFNVPLVDVNDSNAPMEVIPGSHRMQNHGVEGTIYRLPAIHSVKLLMRRGDALLRHGNLLHRGTVNLTDDPRIMLDQTYRSIDAEAGQDDSRY